MTSPLVDRIVAATLYEGYILYPYRPTSVKNQVRWTFGGVHPRAYSEASGGTERWQARTECLVRGADDAEIEVRVRFLHLVSRAVGRLPEAATELDAGALEVVDELRVGDTLHRPWEEAIERDIDAGEHSLASLLVQPHRAALRREASSELEPLRDAEGAVVGALIRDCEALAADVVVSAERLGPELTRVSVVISNATDIELTGFRDRDRAMRRSLVSTHAVLGVRNGRWLSLADPPEDAVEAAAACRNEGMWPVLIGDAEVDDTVLASPIILDDHPQVAPESAGDLYDSTEIDEILSLRILTLTEDEKAEMRAADERGRAMLERTEALSGDDLMRLHGAIRDLRPQRGERT